LRTVPGSPGAAVPAVPGTARVTDAKQRPFPEDFDGERVV